MTSEVRIHRDPWDWNIDEVVSALCDQNAYFRATKEPRALPEPIRLAQKIQELCIDGANLLTILDWPTLKGELGITTLGHLGNMDREIMRLRRGSPKYLDYIRQKHLDSIMLQDPDSIKQQRDRSPDPLLRFTSTLDQSRYPTPSQHTPSSPPAARQTLLPDTPAQSMHITTEIHLSTPHITPKTLEEENRSRLETSIRHSQEWLDQLPDDPGSVIDDVGAPKPPEHQILSRQDETYIIDESGRKRRKLVLVGLPQPTLKDSISPPTANPEIAVQRQETLPASVSPQTSLFTVNDQGCKRITPTLVSQPHDIVGSAKKILGPGLSREHGNAYLGPKAFPMDDIFYNLDFSDYEEWGGGDFAFLNPPLSIGQRRFVSSRLQYFLRQKAGIFQRGNKKRVGICPYPSSFGRKHQNLSITIFEATPDGVLATRRNRSQWLSSDAFKSDHLLDSRGLDIDDNDIQVPLPINNGSDWDYLKKWDHTLEPSTILPIFGESGSEGEYDSDTWREMEKENGRLSKPLGRSKKLKNMSDRESTDIIDRAIKQMIDEWNEKRLPKLARTVWTLWMRSRRDQTMQTKINTLEHEIIHLETRLAKLRKGVADQPWTSSARIKRQCESMRRTVYEIEDSRWTLRILQSGDEPARPPKVLKNKPGNKSFRHEDLTEVETSMDESSADEDLGSFIVDDDELSNPGGDGSLLDASNVDIMVNQGSIAESNDSHRNQQQGPAIKDKADTTTPTPMKEETILPQRVFIDLTLSDEGEPEAVPNLDTRPFRDIKTSSVNAPDKSPNENAYQRSGTKSAAFKIPPGLDTGSSTTVGLEEDNIDDLKVERQATLELPDLFEAKDISDLDPQLLMERADRKRLLIYILAHRSRQQRREVYAYMMERGFLKTRRAVWDVMALLRRSPSRTVRTGDMAGPRVPKIIAAWYICWTSAVMIKQDDGATREQIQLASAEKEGFKAFYEFLEDLQCLIDFETSRSATPERSKPIGRKKPRKLAEYSDDDIVHTPVKKRKYAVAESQEAADIRKKARERVTDLEKRQSKLKKTLRRMGKTEEDASQVVVNMGKLEHQELIYLHSTIGDKIQPHQKDGLRFLWREIIEDHTSKQGCLLAQTMGLGKTMQVISFLVSVAYAAKSSNANIRHQVPHRLRKSQTMVLCPPSLVENWLDEFLLWTPDKITENIGSVQTISSAMTPGMRLQIINDWGRNGGVLVLGFAMLRLLIENNAPKNGLAPLNESQHCLVKEVLLQRPNIIVADEAQFFKNRGSQINQIMGQFKSGSRIALTGSPLSNNLSEYYALIDWIAPGYLGEHKEFKYQYEEPIAQGLYCDSSQGEWRRGLKKLELFKREVAPKIHRADASVLQNRLKGKSEFVIKVASTDLQKRLYQVFVDSMTEECRDNGVAHQAQLLAWIAILRLICNHPKCFYDKLMSRSSKEEPLDRSAETKAATEEQDPVELSPAEAGISESAIRRQLEPFNGLSVASIADVNLANKMKILLHILKLSQATGDRVLVFTHSLPTLDYIADLLVQEKLKYSRMDGRVNPNRRQKLAKGFNNERLGEIFLISTRAGGTGINLFAANRVVIMDDSFNPTWEEQAVGRAYRIGQTKPVFVYRLTVAGTFEEVIHNQSLFKQQLATRAVDKRQIARSATRKMTDYFQPLKDVEQTDLEPCKGKDPDILDCILAIQSLDPCIRAIVPCETFQQEVEEKLTAEEQKEVELEEAEARLRRTNAVAYQATVMARAAIKTANPPLPLGTNAALPVNGNMASETPLDSVPPQHSSAAEGLTRTTQTDIEPGSQERVSPTKQPTAVEGLSKFAGTFGKLVASGIKVSNTGLINSNKSSGQQPPEQPLDHHPLLPISSAVTTLRSLGSLPPEQHHNDEEMTRRAESEPWPPTKAAVAPAKGSSVKYPVLEELLAREAQRTQPR
ncbi:MAG: hypothetical protein Q9182_001951 [Xanthomendoza sp. 2 TL-2023]